MTHPPSIQRFFSEINPASDPFDLLGVDPHQLTDDSINHALRRRLDRLTLHPLSTGPEAEQVRLALHVAAAQLLDPVVRAELLQDLRFTRPTQPAVESTPPRTPFEEEAVRAIVSARGWNAQSKGRIAHAALRHRVNARDAAAIVSRLANPPLAPLSQANAAPLVPPPASRADRHSRRNLRRWAAFLVTLLLVASTIILAERLASIQQGFLAALPTAETKDQSAATESTPGAPSIAIPTALAPTTTGAAPNAVITPSRRPGPSIVPTPEREPAPLPEPVRDWIAQAERLLASPRAETDAPEARLARTVQLARLNFAARLLWKSDADASEHALQSAQSPPTISTSPPTLDPSHDPAALTSPGVEPDGALALELLSLRRQPGQGFDAFKNRRFTHVSLGPVDCDIAAETALIGSPQDLRLIARRIVTDQSDNPAMIHAVLEALPRASRQSTVSSLLAEITSRTLPEIDGPAWPTRARAALVERLAELLAPGVLPDVDALAEMLADAYEGLDAASPSGAPGAARHVRESNNTDQRTTPTGNSRAAEAAAESLWHATLSEAAPYRALRAAATQLDTIVRDREVRLSLAQGPIQRFLATQSAIVELLALIVEQEQPSAAADAVNSQSKNERRSATHIFNQLEINERAITQLWTLRLAGASRERMP